MKMQKMEVWSRALGERQKKFIPAELRSAIQYLHSSRTRGQGWGAFPGMASDLHHTACAVSALSRCKDDSSIGLAADGAIYLRESINGDLASLGLSQLADLISALGSEDKPDEEYLKQIMEVSQARLDSLARNDGELSVVTLARLLRELILLKHPQGDVDFWFNKIFEYQRTDDGGWPVVPGEAVSPLATSAVLRLLAQLPNDDARSAQAKGLRYLQGYVENNSWPTLILKGTFEYAWVLQALAELPAADFGLVVMGVDELLTKTNKDGGWGGGVGEASNVESTSLAIIALVSAGCTSFVPARLTYAALHDARLILDNAENERSRLAKNVEERVQSHCGKVVKERDQLRQHVSSLTGKLQVVEKASLAESAKYKELRDRFSKVAHELEGHTMYRRSSEPPLLEIPMAARKFEERSIYRIFFESFFLKFPATLVGVAIGLVLIMSVKAEDFKRFLGSFDILPVALAGLLIIGLSYSIRRRILNSKEKGYEPYDMLPKVEVDDFDYGMDREPVNSLPALRRLFLRYTEDLEPSVREELVYRLFRDIVDLPPDVGRRYFEEIVVRFGLPTASATALSRWLSLALDLKPRERKVLFEQIRRLILP